MSNYLSQLDTYVHYFVNFFVNFRFELTMYLVVQLQLLRGGRRINGGAINAKSRAVKKNCCERATWHLVTLTGRKEVGEKKKRRKDKIEDGEDEAMGG